MTWQAVGAIGQAVSAFILVLALVQIRHARSETRRALSQGRAEALRDLFAFGSEERIARLTAQADRALGAAPAPLEEALMREAKMTREDALMYVGFQAAFWNYQLQVLSNIDLLSAFERDAFEFGIRMRYRQSSPGRLFYEAIKPHAHPDVTRYIDNLLTHPTSRSAGGASDSSGSHNDSTR